MIDYKKNFTLIPWRSLKLSDRNVRKTFLRIGELADSISVNGLIQNLVVEECDGVLAGVYEIQAGSRRFMAIKSLVESGRLPTNFEVPCLINPHDRFHWANLAENLNREDIPPWHVGYRFSELLEVGITQTEIGKQIGRSQGYISLCVQISSGLAPSVVARLDKIKPGHITQHDCRRLCLLKNSLLHPDEKAQHELLDRLIGESRVGKARARSTQKSVFVRYKKLREEILPKLARHHIPLTESILDYLSGRTRRFKAP